MKKLLGYLSFRGRANRARFWAAQLLLAVLLVIAVMLSFAMMDIAPLLTVILLPLPLGVVVAILANGARRLHDRNKSAWWLLLFVGLPSFFSMFGLASVAGGGSEEAGDLIRFLGLPFSIWWLVEAGCLKGTAGPNKYGEDPLASAAAVDAEPAPSAL